MSGDIYKTVSEETSGLVFKDRKSKFHGYVFPLTDKKEIDEYLTKLRTEHPASRHLCYAWLMGMDTQEYRANDDGEPHNSAGQPILGQIRAWGLTNVLIAVVRYYGGTKLGVGWLINAYRTAAANALENAKIIEREVQEVFILEFGYELTGKVLHLLGKNYWEIRSREMGYKCRYTVGVRRGDKEKFLQLFNGIKNLELRRGKDNESSETDTAAEQ